LAKAAIIIVIICYALLLVKLKPAKEPSEFSKLLQETYEDLSVQRRMELLEENQRRKDKGILGQKKTKSWSLLNSKE